MGKKELMRTIVCEKCGFTKEIPDSEFNKAKATAAPKALFIIGLVFLILGGLCILLFTGLLVTHYLTIKHDGGTFKINAGEIVILVFACILFIIGTILMIVRNAKKKTNTDAKQTFICPECGHEMHKQVYLERC